MLWLRLVRNASYSRAKSSFPFSRNSDIAASAACVFEKSVVGVYAYIVKPRFYKARAPGVQRANIRRRKLGEAGAKRGVVALGERGGELALHIGSRGFGKRTHEHAPHVLPLAYERANALYHHGGFAAARARRNYKVAPARIYGVKLFFGPLSHRSFSSPPFCIVSKNPSGSLRLRRSFFSPPHAVHAGAKSQYLHSLLFEPTSGEGAQ